MLLPATYPDLFDQIEAAGISATTDIRLAASQILHELTAQYDLSLIHI